jgi:AcrR family transcriptional regulator
MAKASSASSTPKTDPRAAVIEALMRLVAERSWDEIELGDIAGEAGISLLALRDLFPSKGAMLAGFGRMIDTQVLLGAGDDLAAEPIHERLFDVMMRRIDALTPYKPALRRLVPVLRRDPVMLAALNGAALNSWRYLLASTHVATEDSLGALRVQGAVIVFARVIDVWLHAEDPALARTMAALDRQLKSGGRIMRRAEDLHRLTAPLRGLMSALCSRRPGSRKRARAGNPPDDSYASAI